MTPIATNRYVITLQVSDQMSLSHFQTFQSWSYQVLNNFTKEKSIKSICLSFPQLC